MGRKIATRVPPPRRERSARRLSEDKAFLELLSRLQRARVRFLLIGVGGVNYYARSSGLLFTTQDRDLFLPLAPANALRAWRAARRMGLDLWCGDEPLGEPLDLFLGRQIVERRALVRADLPGLSVDFTFVMANLEFAQVWMNRRVFRARGVAVPVAALSDIVASKAAVGRPKDRLFLATHEENLGQMLSPSPLRGLRVRRTRRRTSKRKRSQRSTARKTRR